MKPNRKRTQSKRSFGLLLAGLCMILLVITGLQFFRLREMHEQARTLIEEKQQCEESVGQIPAYQQELHSLQAMYAALEEQKAELEQQLQQSRKPVPVRPATYVTGNTRGRAAKNDTELYEKSKAPDFLELESQYVHKVMQDVLRRSLMAQN